MMPTAMQILRGNIVGIVDSHGAVHSQFTGEKVECHDEYWDHAQIRWRWDHRSSIWWITREMKPDEEQLDAIRRHLTKRFNLQWYENGHHDIEHLLARAYPLKTNDVVRREADHRPERDYDVTKSDAEHVWLSWTVYRGCARRRSTKWKRTDKFVLSLTRLNDLDR